MYHTRTVINTRMVYYNRYIPNAYFIPYAYETYYTNICIWYDHTCIIALYAYGTKFLAVRVKYVLYVYRMRRMRIVQIRVWYTTFIWSSKKHSILKLCLKFNLREFLLCMLIVLHTI